MALRITDLPQEILVNVFKRLDVDDVLALEQVLNISSNPTSLAP
jgi:hypothetical protein